MGEGLLVVNIRGTINARSPVREALKRLRITRRHTATIVQRSQSTQGLLDTVKHHAAWCVADRELVEELLRKRGRIRGGKPVSESYLNSLGFEDLSALAKSIVQGEKKLSEIDGIITCFRLSPPRHGFRKSTRRMASQGGVLGKNPELGKLIRAML